MGRVWSVAFALIGAWACGDAATSGVDESPAPASPTSYFFVQHGSTGSMTPIDGGFLLSLEQADVTTYVAERPARTIGQQDTADFVNAWAAGLDSFMEDPPNGALSLEPASGPITISLELHDPATTPRARRSPIAPPCSAMGPAPSTRRSPPSLTRRRSSSTTRS